VALLIPARLLSANKRLHLVDDDYGWSGVNRLVENRGDFPAGLGDEGASEAVEVEPEVRPANELYMPFNRKCLARTREPMQNDGRWEPETDGLVLFPIECLSVPTISLCSPENNGVRQCKPSGRADRWGETNSLPRINP
jgi:hypothetical protein